jgi:hypothetical protein
VSGHLLLGVSASSASISDLAVWTGGIVFTLERVDIGDGIKVGYMFDDDRVIVFVQISHISFVVPIPFQAKLYQKPRDHVKLHYHLINQGFGYIEGTGYTFSLAPCCTIS